MIKLFTDEENLKECKAVYSGDVLLGFTTKGKPRGTMETKTITFENERDAKLCVQIIECYLGLEDYIMAVCDRNTVVIRYNIKE